MTGRYALLLALGLAGCALERGNGSPAVETRPLSGVRAVTSAGSLDVTVRLDAGIERAEVICDENLIEHIVTEVRGGVLHVGVRPGMRIVPRVECSIHIEAEQIEAVRVSGSGDVVVDGTVTDLRELSASGTGAIGVAEAFGSTVTITTTGSGGATLGTLEAVDVEVDTTGTGSVALAGVAERLDTGARGAGSVDAADLAVVDAVARVTGSGGISLRASRHVDVHISGSGDVTVYGDPDVDADVTGSGEVLLR